ncbi:MAG: hypothetical protein D6753_05695 [Planctomycetota bacterium]|nr:MAG: hypothetical protein D6753_05695 [Planctomycetota bacterium]
MKKIDPSFRSKVILPPCKAIKMFELAASQLVGFIVLTREPVLCQLAGEAHASSFPLGADSRDLPFAASAHPCARRKKNEHPRGT